MILMSSSIKINLYGDSVSHDKIKFNDSGFKNICFKPVSMTQELIMNI